MKAYLDLVRSVLETGVIRTDRTGVGTKSLFGTQTKYDLRDGFPLVTTKRVPFSSVVKELLWFISGSTNIKDLGCGIWNEWADADGSIGPGYGAMWRRIYAPSDTLVLVDKRTDRDADFAYPFITTMHAAIDCDLNTDECWAIEDLGTINKNTTYRVQCASGFITTITRPNWRSLKSVAHIDGYARSVCGFGFKGAVTQQPCDDTMYSLWRNMIARCYNEDHPSYASYGGSGVTVSPIWHSYEYFRKTISSVPGYYEWARGEALDLDKDYYGSNVYSPSTCVFLDCARNVGMRKDGTLIEIAGKLYPSYSAFGGTKRRGNYARERWNLEKEFEGIKAADVRVVHPPEGQLWRKQVFVDQLAGVIHQIKTTPDSRRIIMSAWNVADVPDMALPPCHLLVQFYVVDGRLDCQLYQRSADLALGVPFNIASYALLMIMIAQECKLIPGIFTHTIGDAHVYLNHIAGLQEQLTREPLPLPRVLVANVPVFDVKFDDVLLWDYHSHPPIKFDVAV